MFLPLSWLVGDLVSWPGKRTIASLALGGPTMTMHIPVADRSWTNLALLFAAVLSLEPRAAILVPLEGVSRIAAGAQHACAVGAGGGVKCWGANASGQLGDTSITDRPTAVDVAGLAGGVSSISAGGKHTCVVSTSGAVKCWGDNASGQLGDNTRTNRSAPVDVVGASSGFVAVVAGNAHTCGLTTSGGLKCWGDNAARQLGDASSSSPRLTPFDVPGLGGPIAAVTAGRAHTCAVTTGGGALCWGDNSYGQLGNGGGAVSPSAVTGASTGIAAIAAGDNATCLVTSAGSVKCWGGGAFGLPGSTFTDRSLTPVDMPGLDRGVSAIAYGASSGCAIGSGGNVRCWSAGVSGPIAFQAPVDVEGLSSGVMAVSVGSNHACALLQGGRPQCWGDDSHGQLGDDPIVVRPAALDVAAVGAEAVAISSSGIHNCAVTSTGGVKCWGSNARGQLGDGTTNARALPVPVSGLEGGVKSVATGGSSSCAITTSGGVKCWGAATGDGSTVARLTPVNVPGLESGVGTITIGRSHACALMTNGTAKCWGDNTWGAIGDGSTINRASPVDVVGLSGRIATITAASDRTCAVTEAGALKCWGILTLTTNFTNSYQTSTPVDILGYESDISAVALGSFSLCVLTSTRKARCSGITSRTATGIDLPADVAGLESGLVTIGGAGTSYCALTSGGSVKCWGDDRSFLALYVLPGLEGGVRALSTTGKSGCAIVASIGVKCWGDNSSGQLGIGSAKSRPTPAPVIASTEPNYTDLWWNASESGWGIALNHQGEILFGALYTYDASSAPLWLVMSRGERQADGAYVGSLYRATGPAFNSSPWGPIAPVAVGTMRLAFSSAEAATLAYSVDGVTVTKSIVRQAFSTKTTCSWTNADRNDNIFLLTFSYQDLWWNPAESGWGVNIAHQGNTLFATLYTYDRDGRGMWLVMPTGSQSTSTGPQAQTQYSGVLYQVTGPVFNAAPWGTFTSRVVGDMKFDFSGLNADIAGYSGLVTYTVDGVRVMKSIQRMAFSSPRPLCGP
jgi:alpha-tubulin suppressor-like RCC1 family protein